MPSGVKDLLSARLRDKETGRNQFVELPVSLIRAALTDKPAGECAEQPRLLAAVEGMRDGEKVHQPADHWIVIAGELS